MKDHKRILAIIPARAGSKGVVHKNKRLLNGKPLVCYAIENIMQSKYIDAVILSTDDVEIADIGRSMGVDIPFIRPKALSTGDTPLIAVMLHAYGYHKNMNREYDAVII